MKIARHFLSTLGGLLAIASLGILGGCKPAPTVPVVPTSSSSASSGTTASEEGGAPVFSLAWSEYPSWSVFGVADEMGIIDGDEGAMGEIEEKFGVDIVLKEASYDSCLNMFTSKNCDAVCMTNMDALIVSANRDGVAVLPTSTSNGADACIVVGINSLEELKPHKIYGLKGTVSEYCFVRCIEEMEKAQPSGLSPSDFEFTNQDPGAAAVAMAQKQETHQAIMVWNPFVLQTLNDRPDAKVLFDSSKIPGEIVDMVVVGRDVLDKPGAESFTKAVIATFYRMNEELAKPDTGTEVLVELGKKFSQLGEEDMRTVVQQTQFSKSPQEALELMNGEAFKQTMQVVEKFCVDQGLIENPQYGFGSESGKQLLFNPGYLEAAN